MQCRPTAPRFLVGSKGGPSSPHGEGIDLDPVDLAAGEGARECVDRDVLRLDVACGLIDLAIKTGGLDLAALADGAECGVLTEERENAHATVNQLPECDAVELGDAGEANVDFVGI